MKRNRQFDRFFCRIIQLVWNLYIQTYLFWNYIFNQNKFV
ncbi:hypothetical protein pb186bvf_020144 [Paramecium bursaria]